MTTFETLLTVKEKAWPYGDSCGFCAANNHGACLKTRWRVSADTADYRRALGFKGEEQELLMTGGVCGCYERQHEGAKGARSG